LSKTLIINYLTFIAELLVQSYSGLLQFSA